MSKLDAVLAALTVQRDEQRAEIEVAYLEIDRLVRSAFDQRAASVEESNRLLSAALDVECAISGDCKALSDLADEWGAD